MWQILGFHHQTEWSELEAVLSTRAIMSGSAVAASTRVGTVSHHSGLIKIVKIEAKGPVLPWAFMLPRHSSSLCCCSSVFCLFKFSFVVAVQTCHVALIVNLDVKTSSSFSDRCLNNFRFELLHRVIRRPGRAPFPSRRVHQRVAGALLPVVLLHLLPLALDDVTT